MWGRRERQEDSGRSADVQQICSVSCSDKLLRLQVVLFAYRSMSKCADTIRKFQYNIFYLFTIIPDLSLLLVINKYNYIENDEIKCIVWSEA